MLQNAWFSSLVLWGETYAVNLAWSLAVLVMHMLITRFALPRIEKGVGQSKLKAPASKKAQHTIRLITSVLTISLLLIVWGIDFGGLLVISTSLITLTGVALFATWSLLSSVTSYFVLLFHTSFRRGNFIRVIDGDNYIEGYIADVNLFNTRLITDDRETVVYPNNLILTRPTIINPRSRWRVIGKTADRFPGEDAE
ncbi:mechanosensitive ion channel domain-containing protein [Aestuariibacter salexigens]|uniref:mechanosensitive ion channel domain-containing protein n=1 Tax=Aestuariibacter salexigens TaxID=226010 RepID=UPI00041796C8|nr:mechanosensitive ion channel domain-containing protein [Aestuariibacter salexigens]